MKSSQKNDFFLFLKKRGYRVTAERLRLFDGVKRQRGHFNIESLVRRLQEVGFKISRDTVYRNIPILLEFGVIEQSFKTNRDTIYEVAHPKNQHDHILCRRCGRVIEFKDSGIEKLRQMIARRTGFKLEYHCHQLVGLCAKCQK